MIVIFKNSAIFFNITLILALVYTSILASIHSQMEPPYPYPRNTMRLPGFEPGSRNWQSRILTKLYYNRSTDLEIPSLLKGTV